MSSKRKADVHPAVTRLTAPRGDSGATGRPGAPRPGQRSSSCLCGLSPSGGVPNAMLRAALFAAIQGKGRQYMLRKELIATQDGVTIRYTGGAARPGRSGRVGTGPALGPDAGPRHEVLFHGPRLSQSPRPAHRHNRS